MGGGEHYVNMPDMPTCLEAKEVIYNQDPSLYALCIPQEDDTKKVSEMFEMFKSLVEKMKE